MQNSIFALSTIFSSFESSEKRSLQENKKCYTSTKCFSPALINSQSRPGVPTIACGLCLSKRSCFSIDIPPTIGTTMIVVYFAADRKWSHTCQEQQKNQERHKNL
jgi:hypothetical protein